MLKQHRSPTIIRVTTASKATLTPFPPWKMQGIGTFGYDRIDYRDVNGVKVALIGTYELAKHLDIQDELKQNIKTAKENGAQLVAVYFH